MEKTVKCNVCGRDMVELGQENMSHHLHLLVTKSMIDGHVHTHGDLENKEAMTELVKVAQQELGMEQGEVKKPALKEVVFKNRQRIGDMLMFTCGVRDFKKQFPEVRVNVISTAGHVWDHNPNVDRTLVATAENTVEIGPGSLTNKSNSRDWHFANAFRVSIEEKLGVRVEQGLSRPDIYFTQEEWDAPRVIPGPYWIICTNGEKGWGCKMYPHNKWQEVVDQNPDITFVQIGTAEDNAPRLKGANVIDWIGKTQARDTGLRDLFKLFLNSEGSIGLVSFHMHLSGALYKPCVVVAGAREPVSFTRYAGHAYLSNDGMLPCAIKACWHCSIDTCTDIVNRPETLEKKIPKCADIIESEDITRAIRGYYKGGRLSLEKPIEKPTRFFKNVVPTPPKVEAPKEEPKAPLASPHGMTWGGGSLTDRDWEFIQSTIKKYNVRTVLEFGAGLSTLLFHDAGMKTVTFETQPGWIKKITDINSKCKIRLWDGVNFDISQHARVTFDMAFVDGPAGDQSREVSTGVAANFANIVIVHDAGREYARKYQAQYIEPFFDGPFKGGHRCHLWVRKGIIKTEIDPVKVAQTVEATPDCSTGKGVETILTPKTSRKYVKIVSTARGWGGCARSITTIMKYLLADGHRVQFIPFRNAVGSREFQEILKGELKDVDVALGYSAIKEACDVMLVYADDYVWEFKTDALADIFSEVNAEKKIMMLNYRRGEVGKVPWTQGWDKYMFLCSAQEQELLRVYPQAQGKTKVLPPCTILEPFLAVQPNYEHGIRIVRHNSQGDTKFISTAFTQDHCRTEILGMLNCREDLTISMMPGPTFIPEGPGFGKVPKTANTTELARFLATGNLYWYSLPTGYMDMGPRVILEAMAVGLPCLVDTWSGGAVDRISQGGGWAEPNKIWSNVVEGLSSGILRHEGQRAKQIAYEQFRPEAWIEELLK